MPKLLIRLWTDGKEVEGAVQYSKMSSACKLILWQCEFVWITVMLVFCLMAEASGSMKSAKRSDDNGHPCLVLLFRVKDLDIKLLVITNVEGELYRILIQLVK